MASHASLRRSRHCVKRHDSFDLGSFYTLYEDLPAEEERENTEYGHRPRARDTFVDEGPWLLVSHEATVQERSPFVHNHEASALCDSGASTSSALYETSSKPQESQEPLQQSGPTTAQDESSDRLSPSKLPPPARYPNDTNQLQIRPVLALPTVTRSESRFSDLVQEPKALLTHIAREPTWHTYLTILGSFLACAASLGLLSATAAFQAYDANRYPTLSPSQIRWLGTCQVFFFLFGGILAGPLTDRFGPQLLLVTAAVLSSLGCAASSFAEQFWFFVGTQGVLLGMGASLGFTPAIACIMQCIGSRRATCVGVALSGASAGAILWPVVVRIIAETKTWKIVWLALAVSQLLLLSVAALLVRQPSILLSSASQARQDYSPLVRSSSGRSRPFLTLAVFSLPSYSLSIAGQFFIWVGFFYLFFYLPEWTSASGISVTVQTHMPTIISSSAFVGSLLLPFLADVTGRYEIMVLCAFSGSVLLLGSIPVRNPTALLLVAAIYGFTTGGTIALQAPVLVEAIDEPEAFGTVLGQGLAAIAPAALIGPPLYGLILRAPDGGLACAQVVAGFCMVIGGILLIYARLCSGRTFSHG